MNDSKKTKTRFAGLGRAVWAVIAVWTGVIVASLTWNIVLVREETLDAARIQARVAYEKDIIYRRWNTRYGGVYVPVSKGTEPNPYLSDIPERDITTPSGKQLTLMNPAYMTRQVHELAEKEHGVRGHITSLNPIRPQNAADPWETRALRAFESGKTEISSVEGVRGEEYMRLMRPLITEKGCLRCHAAYGSQEGDIRGGISVSIPMEPMWTISHRRALRLLLGHGFLWLMGLVAIVFVMQRLTRSEQERKQAEESLRKAVDELEKQVEERTRELSAANEELKVEITDHNKTEEELRRANRALKMLSECNQLVVRAGEEPHLLHEICRIIVDIGGYRLAWVGFAEQDEAKTVQPVSQAGYEEGYLDTLNITWADTEQGRGPTGTAIRAGKPIVAKHILTDPNFTPWRAEASKRGYKSAIALPLINDSQAFGALNIYAKQPDAFDAKEIKLLMELADDLAYGIIALRTLSTHKLAEAELSKYRAHLEELVEERTNELKKKTGKVEKSYKALTYLVEDVNEAGEKLRKANMEYDAANKELKEFAYIVSHDLKAPLRAISQLTHWISEDYSKAFDDDGKMQMDLILKRVKRMDGLIEGILRYSRVGRIREKEERLDLNHLVNDVIDNIAPPGHIKITTKNELPVVFRDSVRMEQVFQNLIGNAIKYMDKPEGIIQVECVDEGEQWKFNVADNGPGIDKRYHDKIFQIFQTLTPRDSHESTGIGLTLVKKIIGLYGGTVRVESEVGKGSTFVFTLPKK